MSEEHAMKTCPMCCMEIPSKAKKCPYCRHWQHRLWTVMNHPGIVVLFCFLPLAAAYAAMLMVLGQPFREWERFSAYSDQITITESKLEFGEGQCGPVVAIVGKLKNLSPVDWKDVRFHVDFYNPKGDFFDTGQQEAFTYRLLAGQETGFKVSLRREFPEKEYASYKARVISALDSRQRF